MRPKKVILLASDDEQELSIFKFLLENWGYRVLAVPGGEEAIEVFSGHVIDLVMANCSMPKMSGAQLVKRLKRIAAHVPMMLMGDLASVGAITWADEMIVKKNCLPAELHERVKVLSARKRGPRKKGAGAVSVSANASASVKIA